jgi:hypothetical protein
MVFVAQHQPRGRMEDAQLLTVPSPVELACRLVSDVNQGISAQICVRTASLAQ